MTLRVCDGCPRLAASAQKNLIVMAVLLVSGLVGMANVVGSGHSHGHGEEKEHHGHGHDGDGNCLDHGDG
eukprot:SAG11_NODE_5745_length_1473_cov_1.343523_2_plen_69_part_01